MFQFHKVSSFFILTMIFLPHFSVASSVNWEIDLSNSKGTVSFLAIGRPSALKIKGESDVSDDKLKGKIEGNESFAKGQVQFSLDSLKTGIKLRDRHMKKKYLETADFPLATFKFSKLVLHKDFFKGESSSVQDLPIKGQFKVHGNEKPIEGKLTLKRVNNELEAILGFTIKLTDYQIDIPSFMGVTVAENVDISANVNTQISFEK